MIVMDRKGERVYFDTIEEAKEWSYCDDESITTAEDLEEWMTKENGGIVAHTFDEVEEDDNREKYPDEDWEMAEQDIDDAE